MEGKKLYRSREDRVIAGVAGGLAEYFNIDSTLVRIIIVILAIWGGFGLIAYIIGAIVIPEEPGGIEMADKKTPKRTVKKEEPVVVEQRTEEKEVFDFKRMQGEQIFGLIVLFIGLIFLLEAFIPGFSFGKLWPLILIGLGLWMISGRGRE